MQITLVKKVREDGSPCRKCADVEQRLVNGGYMDRIDHIVIADEVDPESDGMKLAKLHNVELAPFFIVEQDDQEPVVYTVYFRFLKEVLTAEA
jgi:hypothetical protein